MRSLAGFVFVWLAAAFVAAACAAPAVAQEVPASASAAKFKWDAGVWAAGATGEELTDSFAEAQLFSAGVRITRKIRLPFGPSWFRRDVSWGCDFAPIFWEGRPASIRGGGFDPLLFRWGMKPRGRVRPYIEISGGATFTARDFPSVNTSTFNFDWKLGPGFQIPVARNRALDVSLRFAHISNGNIGNRNPEFNGFQLTVGHHWLW